PKRFANQMCWLKRLGYTGLSMRDIMPYVRVEKQGKVIGLTFDDGYKNVYQDVLPLLNELGFTATNYIVSNHLGGTNFLDAKNGVPSSTLMNQNEIMQWVDARHETGSHTQDHVYLTRITAAEAKKPIFQPNTDLEQLFGIVVVVLLYPYG